MSSSEGTAPGTSLDFRTDGTAAAPADRQQMRAAARQPYRREAGGRVDRSKPVNFTFDGKPVSGYAGDTIASALLANGIHMIARGFKYHRPRGVASAGSDDPAGLVQIGSDAAVTDPNTRASEQEIYAGLEVKSQNAWPSLGFDVGAINDVLHQFLPSGFYYKTFMGPPGSWMGFEKIIRAAAGLGVAPKAPDPDHYDHINHHCEVLVVGGGPAGLSAARAAARSGARVVLCEETAELGGWLLSADPDTRIEGLSPVDWIASVEAELRDHPEVRVLTRTCAYGYYAENQVNLWEKVVDHQMPADRDPRLPRQRNWRIRAREVVLATGATERPLLFPGNDRPGILLASAALTFAERYGVLIGRKIAVVTNNDTGYDAACRLKSAGAGVVAVIDQRATAGPGVAERASSLGIQVRREAGIVATKGRKRISALEVRRLGLDGTPSGPSETIACDALAVAGGFSPNVALFSQSRGQLRYEEAIGAFVPGRSVQRERSAGAANGTFDLAGCLAAGEVAGAEATTAAGFAAAAQATPDVVDPSVSPGVLDPRTVLPTARAGRTFVDTQNDVTVKDLRLAVQEGYHSVEHAKRYTTTGMGTDQGKTVNVNAFAVLADKQTASLPQIGTTTFRQPYKPVTFGAVAGAHTKGHFHPRRTTAMHDWHVQNGAVFETVGDWLRPWVYPQVGESPEAALQREVRAARTEIGVLDASTLGKIDIRGKDARTFLNRVYTNAWSKLAPGRCRYGLMLNEDGMVFDDGVTTCLADDHFHMTTTTGGAARVLAWLEDYLQTEWPDLDVRLTSVTEQWAVVSLTGPRTPELMADLVEDIDPSPDAFPFMSWQTASIDGLPARVFRISFTGGLSYEINVPASYGLWLWQKVMDKGAAYGITPYGTEAMHLLRAEAGFIIVGQDTDGTMTPIDLRMDKLVSETKGDFIGKRSLSRSDTVRTDRRQLVGLLTEDPSTVLTEGAHVIETAHEPAPPVPMLGHVTSSYYSPTLARSIAFAAVKSGGARLGETVYVTRHDGGAPIKATITELDFLAQKEAGRV
ncbi:sarcosine oxidase subunit alpha family protein [Amorphus sp. 3PC139-8]|uniref:sarcosine oxidase subunit alpha family protein n=1 Tax=Amorphus sp. 3PC139-8 TaxID=2735676 RepID=UPI00345DA304